MTLPPQVGVFLSSTVMSFWAFMGAVMRRNSDWRDPATGKMSWPRVGISVATALVLGQTAVALGGYMKWEPAAIGALASFMGYMGPAATLQLFQKRFLGENQNAAPNK